MTYYYKTVKLPKIRPIRWTQDGFGIQVIHLPPDGFVSRGESTAPVPRRRIQRGYVKVWFREPEPHVVDRALTYKAALRRKRELKLKGYGGLI